MDRARKTTCVDAPGPRWRRPRLAMALALLALAAPARADEVLDAFAIPPANPDPPSNFLLSIESGASVRYAYHDIFSGGRLTLVVGGQNARMAIGARLDGESGLTQHGLIFGTFALGPAVQFRVSRRLRVGFGVAIDLEFVSRVTRQGTIFDTQTGPWVQLAVDLWQTEAGMLFVGAHTGADVSITDGFVIATGILSLGYRTAWLRPDPARRPDPRPTSDPAPTPSE